MIALVTRVVPWTTVPEVGTGDAAVRELAR